MCSVLCFTLWTHTIMTFSTVDKKAVASSHVFCIWTYIWKKYFVFCVWTEQKSIFYNPAVLPLDPNLNVVLSVIDSLYSIYVVNFRFKYITCGALWLCLWQVNGIRWLTDGQWRHQWSSLTSLHHFQHTDSYCVLSAVVYLGWPLWLWKEDRATQWRSYRGEVGVPRCNPRWNSAPPPI